MQADEEYAALRRMSNDFFLATTDLKLSQAGTKPAA
jgi:hypothetical protein